MVMKEDVAVIDAYKRRLFYCTGDKEQEYR